MQNEKKHSFIQNIRDKGYYIVLGLCVAAVGVSGYLFSRSVKSPVAKVSVTQEVLSAAPSVTVPPAQKNASEKTGDVSGAVQEVIGNDAPKASDKPVLATEEKLSATVSPVDGQIVQTYSMEQLAYNPTTRDWRTHDGIDLLAPVGTEVYAAADGTVEAVFCDDFFGQTVKIRHGDGYVTQYANLAEEILVTVGQKLHAGDPVGRIGQTALLEVGEKPHLHFSVYRNDVSMDPQDFLS